MIILITNGVNEIHKAYGFGLQHLIIFVKFKRQYIHILRNNLLWHTFVERIILRIIL